MKSKPSRYSPEKEKEFKLENFAAMLSGKLRKAGGQRPLGGGGGERGEGVEQKP